MAAEGAVVVVFVLLALAVPLALYALVRDERARDASTVADREAAERAARRDTDEES